MNVIKINKNEVISYSHIHTTVFIIQIFDRCNKKLSKTVR